MFQIFKNIFAPKKKVQLASLEDLAVDLHSHLIPGIDDGSKSKEESHIILNRLVDLGYKKIITTPHIMSGGYDNTTAIIQNGKSSLNTFLQEQNFPLTIEASAEYYLDGHFEDLIKKKDLIPFGKNYILFELSYVNRPQGMENIIFELSLEGYQPILAHPERYPFLGSNDLHHYKKIKDAGTLFQLNLFSLVGAYGESAKLLAHQLIDEKMIDFVSTDIHNQAQLAYFEPLLQSIYLDKLIQQDLLKNKTLL